MVTSKGKITQNWQNFLRAANDNKTELFNILAHKIAQISTLVTREDDIASNHTVSIDGLARFSHEEADMRIFLHARNAAEEGSKVLIVKANDIDVLVIAISALSAQLPELKLEAFQFALLTQDIKNQHVS